MGLKILVIYSLMVLLVGIRGQDDHPPEIELVPQDGWFNNLVHPDWGAIDGQLIRKSVPAYSDGVYHMAGRNRPNPFDVSKTAHAGKAGLGSVRGRNALMVYFGQQVVEEIVDSQRPGCPREFENIPVPKNHPYNVGNKDDLAMPFLRTRYDSRTGYSPNNPRQQLNEISPYLDGTLFYGPAKAWTDAIREFKNGKLKAKDPSVDIKNSFPDFNNIRLPYANPPAPRDHQLKPINRFLRIGNPRGNENPLLLSFAIIFYRWHNLICDQLIAQHPTWNDEELFNEARKRVIAHHQKIVMYDWLPPWLGIESDLQTFFKIPSYYRNENCTQYCGFDGYSSEIHPGIMQEFQTSAMRFGHTLVTPGVWIRGPQKKVGNEKCNWKSVQLRGPGDSGDVHALRLCNAYWNAQETVEPQLDDLIRGMTSTLAEKEDNIMVPDLREHVFGPLDFSRRDLGAINIQRGRDHGLPGYNDVREAFGLKRKDSWAQINPARSDGNGSLTTHKVALTVNQQFLDPTRHLTPTDNSALNISLNNACLTPTPFLRENITRNLQLLYGNTSAPDELDLFSGGLLETTDNGPGELFQTIMLEQFLRIRHADRFWFENKHPKFRLFSDKEIEEIHRITLRDIILNVTSVSAADIPENVFMHRNASDPCPQPQQLAADTNNRYNGKLVIENCTKLQHYDYFYGSEVSFPLTFVCLVLCVPGCIGIMLLMAKIRRKDIAAARRKLASKKEKTADPNAYSAVEWVGPNTGERNVKIMFDKQRRKLHVTDIRKKPLRMIDLRRVSGSGRIFLRLANDGQKNVLSVRVPNDIDLILRFTDEDDKAAFLSQLEVFLRNIGVQRDVHEFSEKTIFKQAETKEERQKVLDTFLRVICLQAFKRTPSEMELQKLSTEEIKKVQMLELSRTEFADALGLKPTSIFIRNMFLVVDKDKSGSIGFQEFLDMFMILVRRNAEDKALMIFNMYDVRRSGHLTKEEITKMIRSLLDLSDSAIGEEEMKSLLSTMYKKTGLSENEQMDFDSFKKIFASEEYAKTLESATLGFGILQQKPSNDSSSWISRKRTFIESYKTNRNQRRKTLVKVKAKETELPPTYTKQALYEFLRWVENYRLQIFWVTLYTLVTLGIFAERAYYYSVEREHAGLRRIAGYGVTVTRGAASGMMWTYSCLLVTMSRNMLTFLRETFFHRFIPFDSAYAFHKYIAGWALFFTVVHCIGHGINLYHISTQASSDLNCVFRNYFRATDVLASFHYWAFTTITGMTGIILTLIVIVIYVFAIPYARKYVFSAFWNTHSLYIFLYIFMVLHGSGILVQDPLFQNFFYGPMVVFLIDKMFSLSRKKREINVFQADLLPSDVTALKFKRPLDFEYKSGQWVRIACLGLGEGEYHPFTLTSAPHEDFLSLHIRAVGPWTINLRSIYDANNLGDEPPPKLYLDGPFGEGHQDWYKFPVAVLVGGGIGVTPFASILKDIVFKSQNPSVHFPCKQVYFLWVTRTQKQFEWLTDIIREVENADTKGLVSVHIFITQFQQKFDLRTTMLYICERHFEKIAGKSLFTGLRATTHFGRPQFKKFLSSLHYEHSNVNHIGVFSCGPSRMTLDVDKACTILNKYNSFPIYTHHFENF